MPSRRDILLWSAASALPWGATLTAADAPADLTRVLPPGEKPTDPRLGPPKTTREGYFPFVPSKTVEEWTKRRKELREQVLVANGLWPMPEKTPLNPVIHGSIDRNGYTVEKVFFASTPGHYVTGNLYRPKPNGAKPTDSLPAILCSYGHFPDGRLGQTTDATVTKSLASGGEGTKESARYPLQARSAALAKLGFVVFHYDMVGYADSTAIPHVLRGGVPHPNGFGDVEGELRLQSLMGLQTWNTVRALDFLESLPGVDPKRLGITGESGGATQVILLGAIDDRLAAAFPAVMVGTAMQGGCVCENCTYLRVGTGNVELSGLFAPKPLAMSGANDWTKEIMTKGYPELKQLYKLLGAEENVAAKAWVQFPHGFNQVAREFMESWFSKHLLGKAEDVKEPPLVPVPPKELAVFDADHPRPADELDAPKLRAKLTKASDEQMAKLPPAEFRRVVGTALRVMVGELPVAAVVRKGPEEVKLTGGVRVHKAVIGRDGGDDTIPTLGVLGEKFTGNVVVWVDPAGKASLFEKGELVPAARRLTDAGYGILAPDLLGTGELTPEKPFAVNPAYAGYTFAYNRPLLANRVRDVLTAIAFARSALKAKAIHLTGWGAFGPVAVLAKAAAGDAVGKTAADLNKFRFENIKDVNDEMLLPGAVKYGGLPAFLALCAPGPILAYNPADGSDGKVPTTAYDAAGAKRQFALEPARLSAGRVVDWLTA